MKPKARQSVTVTLDKEVDVSRDDVIVAGEAPCEVSNQFEIELVWMDQEPSYLERFYWMKLSIQTVVTQITNIKYKINLNTFEHLSAAKLKLNDFCVVTMKNDRPIPFEAYKACPGMGGLILINRMSNQTVTAGMIKFALRRASNVHRQKLDVNKKVRRLIERSQQQGALVYQSTMVW